MTTEQIHRAFVAQARRTPDAVAVIAGTRRVTYAQLDRMSMGVALTLRRDGVRPDDLVAVCLERDEWLLAGLLGVLRAGASYLPLDRLQPTARLTLMVKSARPARLLATVRTASLVPGLMCFVVNGQQPPGARCRTAAGMTTSPTSYTRRVPLASPRGWWSSTVKP